MADGAGGLPAEAAGGVSEVAPEGVAEVLGELAPRDAAEVPEGGPVLAPSTTRLRAGASAGGPPPPLREGGAGGRRRNAPSVRYSEAVAGRIVARVAGGESVSRVCRDRDMPNAASVYNWARAEPRFGRALAVAHQTARRAAVKAQRKAAAERWARGRDPRGRWSTYTPELAEEICWRVMEGQSLRTIGADPEMPCAATILRWVREIPGFEDRYRVAKETMADVMFEEIRDVSLGATPGTVWVARLQIETSFRMLTRMRPRKYCERVIAEEAIAERRAETDHEAGGLTVIVKRFSDVTPEEEEAARLTEEGYFDRPGRRG